MEIVKLTKKGGSFVGWIVLSDDDYCVWEMCIYVWIELNGMRTWDLFAIISEITDRCGVFGLCLVCYMSV